MIPMDPNEIARRAAAELSDRPDVDIVFVFVARRGEPQPEKSNGAFDPWGSAHWSAEDIPTDSLIAVVVQALGQIRNKP